MITIENDAMQFMDNGDETKVIDENGIIANNCDDDSNGLISVGSVAYDSFVTYPYNIHLSEGIYDCNESNCFPI